MVIVNGIEIKPGMVIIGTPKSKRKKLNITVIAFPKNDEIGFVPINDYGWSSSYTSFIKDILYIKEASTSGFLDGGKILWEKQ